MSRTIPPNVAVITPITTAMNAPTSWANAFCAPTMQKNDSPTASSQSSSRYRDSGICAVKNTTTDTDTQIAT
jgi:hypothetical protein